MCSLSPAFSGILVFTSEKYNWKYIQAALGFLLTQGLDFSASEAEPRESALGESLSACPPARPPACDCVPITKL